MRTDTIIVSVAKPRIFVLLGEFCPARGEPLETIFSPDIEKRRFCVKTL